MKVWIAAGHGESAPSAVLGERLEKGDALRFAPERRFWGPEGSQPGADYYTLYLAERKRMQHWWARAVRAEDALEKIYQKAREIMGSN